MHAILSLHVANVSQSLQYSRSELNRIPCYFNEELQIHTQSVELNRQRSAPAHASHLYGHREQNKAPISWHSLVPQLKLTLIPALGKRSEVQQENRSQFLSGYGPKEAIQSIEQFGVRSKLQSSSAQRPSETVSFEAGPNSSNALV